MSDQKGDWKIVGQVATGFDNNVTVRVQPITWERFLDHQVEGEENPMGPISLNLPADPEPDPPGVPDSLRQRGRTRKRHVHLSRLDRR